MDGGPACLAPLRYADERHIASHHTPSGPDHRQASQALPGIVIAEQQDHAAISFQRHGVERKDISVQVHTVEMGIQPAPHV
jgi:hypothetical protein